jgi:hypothetical protein
MKKMLLIGGLIAAASLLNGCMIISCDEHRAMRHPRVICPPPGAVVKVVPAPPGEPGPPRHGHRPREWR